VVHEQPDPGVEVPDLAYRLRATAAEHGDRDALVCDGLRLTYAELHARVDRATALLQELGVGPGDRVALILGNVPAFVEVYAATLRAGAAIVPLLPGLAPDELRHALADSGAKVAVVGPERAVEVAQLAGELDELEHLLAVDAPDVDAADWAEATRRPGDPTPVERAPEDLAALVYTSGTTGRPKGAVLTRANLSANQSQSLAGRFEVGAEDVVLLVLPLAHIYALNVGLGACIASGATMLLVERFDPEQTLQAMAEHGASVVLGAPPMYVAWLEGGHLGDEPPGHPGLAEVRLAVSGAAPLPMPVLHRFTEATGIVIEEGYGLTEASPSVTSNAMAPRPRPGSVGLALPDVELRIVREDGTDVEVGDPGEVWVRGPNVFEGYWRDDEATAAALTSDGWLKTGDVGTLDEDGFLFLVDRLRDLIIVNGFNVYPREVERVLLGDESVAQAAVVGEADPRSGERVVAHVVPRAGAEVDVAALEERCRRLLARYKQPSRIEVADSVPTTATGKVRRRLLRGEDEPEA
jgi:long-chain acyl-CoA synthetase